MRFQGKRALVTGAAGGIGRAAAVLLASEGASLAVHYRDDADGAERTATACGMASGTVPAVLRGDLARWAECEQVIADAAASLGGLDVLVCGDELPEVRPVSDESRPLGEAAWHDVVETGLRVACALSQAAGAMMHAGAGAIVLVGSRVLAGAGAAAILRETADAGYSGLAHALARRLGASVRVNAVLHGRARAAPEGGAARPARPEDIARVVLFLASEDAALVTGQALRVDTELGGGSAARG